MLPPPPPLFVRAHGSRRGNECDWSDFWTRLIFASAVGGDVLGDARPLKIRDEADPFSLDIGVASKGDVVRVLEVREASTGFSCLLWRRWWSWWSLPLMYANHSSALTLT